MRLLQIAHTDTVLLVLSDNNYSWKCFASENIKNGCTLYSNLIQKFVSGVSLFFCWCRCTILGWAKQRKYFVFILLFLLFLFGERGNKMEQPYKIQLTMLSKNTFYFACKMIQWLQILTFLIISLFKNDETLTWYLFLIVSQFCIPYLSCNMQKWRRITQISNGLNISIKMYSWHVGSPNVTAYNLK